MRRRLRHDQKDRAQKESADELHCIAHQLRIGDLRVELERGFIDAKIEGMGHHDQKKVSSTA
jgi:hypothetical protein